MNPTRKQKRVFDNYNDLSHLYSIYLNVLLIYFNNHPLVR